jgi:type II secretory pathway pseudopilin PulG
MRRGLTLIEIIVMITIVATLALIGWSQYPILVEKSRLSEAMQTLNTMRNFAETYFYETGSLEGLQNNDVGVDKTCTSTGFFKYWIDGTSDWVDLIAERCTSGGKLPNASRGYLFALFLRPSTGERMWLCAYNDDGSSCFGYEPGLEYPYHVP